MLPRCSTCHTLLVEIELGWHCAGCESALVSDSVIHQSLAGPPIAKQLRATGPGQPCPRCGRLMTAGELADSHVDRCNEHGVWLSSDELERLAPEVACTRRDIVDAWIVHFAARLGARPAHHMVAGAVAIDIDDELHLRMPVPAFAGTSLKLYFGDVRGGDAETGDAAFDRAWRILTDTLELAKLVFAEPVRTLCQRTRTVARGIELAVEVAIAQGDVTVALSRDYDLDRAVAAVSLARAIAARPEAIDAELRALATALGGTPRSGAWTWRGGFAATVPCGRAVATLAIGDGEARIVVEGNAPVGWARMSRALIVRSERPYTRASIPGYFVDGEVAVDADLVAAARPDTIQLGVPFRPAPRCEVAWRGWVPPIDQLRAALRLAADALGDATAAAGPYR